MTENEIPMGETLWQFLASMDRPTVPALHQALNQFKQAHKVSEREIGRRIGRSDAYVNMLIRGRKGESGGRDYPVVGDETVRGIATLLNWSIDDVSQAAARSRHELGQVFAELETMRLGDIVVHVQRLRDSHRRAESAIRVAERMIKRTSDRRNGELFRQVLAVATEGYERPISVDFVSPDLREKVLAALWDNADA